ncbi:Translin [Gymnopilus junonius]|uniref:Translin n=1 Tax=Gymnopilus junonius TaxID=109634 RepID=A0A9P5NJY9_GYMJU|nr:Translin [Gymnopilus junonius]
MSTVTTSIQESFNAFRAELDDYNDRRERLIKTIFLLHRIAQGDVGETADDVELGKRAAQQGYQKLREIQGHFSKLQPELEGDKFWRYQRQVSPGLQEYIEALSLAHYLDHGSLITYEEVQRTLVDPQGIEYFPLPVSDYLLGLSDLTGELMRFAISSIARRGGRKKASQVCAFVRACKADFERMTPYIRELSKKQAVTAQSLEKIEDAAYAIVVRSSEYDLPPDMLDDIVAQSVSNYHSYGDETRQASGHRRGSGMSDDEDD